MIVVADSGGTKCTWAFTDKNSNNILSLIKTEGYNPLFFSETQITDSLNANEEISNYKTSVTEVYFYGAGVSSESRKAIINNALKNVFVNATTLIAEHDMLAAAIATCGRDAGIACILGTGSNSCYYDGKNLYDTIPALGHILGDEAGGAWLGKELLKHYLYGRLSKELHDELTNEYGLNKELIFEAVYAQKNSNKFLASVAPFVHKHQENTLIKSIIEKGMLDFFEYHVIPYYAEYPVPVHCVGSVGVEFSNFFKAACQHFNIPVGKIIREPINELVTFHSNP